MLLVEKNIIIYKLIRLTSQNEFMYKLFQVLNLIAIKKRTASQKKLKLRK